MKKINVFIEPFTINQKVIVYDDQNVLSVEDVDLDSIPATIVKKSQEYCTNKIDIYGPSGYMEKIGADIGVVAYKYDLQNLEINYI